MRSSYLRALFAVAAIGALGTVTTSAHAQVAFAIAGGGANLISFNVASPSTILSSVALTGNNGFGLDAIDFRPLNGVLYGYNDNLDTLYTVDTNTGALSVVANSTGTAGETNAFGTGLDFNPFIDRVRVVNDASENRVYNPNSNAAATAATNLFYAPGDSRAGVTPNVVDNAYNNNLAGRSGTQFGIDYVQGTLVTIANNNGDLNTVGSLGLSAISQFAGFDIFTTADGVNFAYGLFDTSAGGESTGTSQSLYSVNLSNGAASLIGRLGNNTSVYSLAVTPTVAPAVVPEAGTLPLLMGGVLSAGLGIVARRRLKK